MALGAQAAQVRWLFLRQAIQPLCVATAVGLMAALGVGLLTVFLMQTEPYDPLILVGTLALMVALWRLRALGRRNRLPEWIPQLS